ncbi:MAG: PolC-type DNA polymerase III [Clostridiales bacterium]|nr:PolC-type DNA polymerase III [Clostridiales bacterium]
MELFKYYFGEYVNNYQLSYLQDAEIVRFVIKSESREIELTLKLFQLVDFDVIDKAQESIKQKMNLKAAYIKPRYVSRLFEESYINSILSFVKKETPVANGFFEGASAELNGGELKIFLKKGGAAILENGSVHLEIQRVILDMFGLDLNVSFVEENSYDINDALKELSRQKEQERAEQEKQKALEEESREHTLLENTPLYIDTSKLIFGNKASNDRPRPIKDVKIDDGVVTVWGDILKCETRDTKRGRNKSLTFDISDYTSSLTVKVFDDKRKIDALEEKLQNAKTVIVSGDYALDKYLNEYIISPRSICSVLKQEKEDTAEIKRIELHCHTSLSQLDAISSPTDIVKRAAKWGHRAIAITDHGVVQALPEAYNAAKKAGIKLILGVEAYLVDDEKYPGFMDMKIRDFKRNHVIILIKNTAGRKALYKLISESNTKHFKTKPLILKSRLAESRENLIIGSACEQGEVYQAVLNGAGESELDAVASFYDYLEIQPNGNNEFMLRTSSSEYYLTKKGEERKNIYWQVNTSEDLIENNKKIIAAADRLGKMTVATGDVHFLNETDAKFRAIIMAAKGFDNADDQPPLYFKTTDEMLADFSWAGDRAEEFVITNPNKIADLIDDDVRPIPAGTFQPHIDGAEEEIYDICHKNAQSIYGSDMPEFLRQRLDKELDSIIKHGYAVLYVIAKRLVENSEQNGYHVGSRGSVGSSVAAYFSGISEVNPLPPHYVCPKCCHSEFILDGSVGSGFDLPVKACPVCGEKMTRDGQEIPFETFLGFDGDKEPDIDLNFSGDYQSSSHRFTEELFGKTHVFKAGTIGNIADKTAYGYVKKYLEERMTKVSRAEEDRLTKGCTGVKRTTGQHPGGMVIVPAGYEVEDFTPIQYPSDDPSKGMLTTHFDFKNALHDTLLKLDELGHDVPTMYKFLEDATGVSVMQADLCDPKLYQMLTSTAPIGVSEKDIDCPTSTLSIPEMGTPFVIGMLTEARPSNFQELVQISGLSHGTNVWLDNAQTLIKNGTCTISEVIGCRDDIMRYLLRKCEDYEKNTGNVSPLSKKDCFQIMEIVRKGQADKKLGVFEDAMHKVGVEDWYIDSCHKIKYLYPKSHATAYVIAALRLGWYKIYYPVEYYSAYFTVRGGDLEAACAIEGKQAVRRRMDEIMRNKESDAATQKELDTYTVLQIVIEMLSRNVHFLPVDLYKSDWRVYKIEGGKIRLPFSSIPGVGEIAAKSIFSAAQSGGEFTSCDDLMARAHIGMSVVDSLRECNALGDLPLSDQISLF